MPYHEAVHAKINVSDVIGRSAIRSIHRETVLLCFVCLILDGFDVQALGYVAPAIIDDWGIPPASLGVVFGAGNLGVLVGSLAFSALADKVGRRPVLIGASAWFALLTLATAAVSTVEQLLAIRFVAGLGLGGIIPNATALVGEYSPYRLRVTWMGMISIGFTIGAVFGGVVSAWLIPSYGWQSVFVVGGAVPLIITIVMWRRLPESIPFLVLSGRSGNEVARLLQRISPGADEYASDAEYVVTEERRSGVPLRHLFTEGRGGATARLWTINFMNLLLAYFLSSWLTTVVRDYGYATSTAVLTSTTMQLGGVAGTVVLVWLISRKGFRPVLTVSFVLGAAAIATIGQAGPSLGLLLLAVCVAGGCIIGGQPALNALSGTYYPTYLRATAIGWALGVGRSGAIVGPVIASELIRRQWSPSDLFLAATVPALVSGGLMLSWRPKGGATP